MVKNQNEAVLRVFPGLFPPSLVLLSIHAGLVSSESKIRVQTCSADAAESCCAEFESNYGQQV